MGVVRDYRVLGDDIVVSLSSERQHVAAQGAAGGKRGGLGAFVLNPDMPEERMLPAAGAEIKLSRDSVLRIVTPGGGGYGEARERDRISIERDLREGRITSNDARQLCLYKRP